MQIQPIITVKDWRTGIANNPQIGFGKMVGIDTEFVKGAIRPNPRPQNKLSSNDFTPYYFTKGASRYYAAGDNGSAGKVYSSTDGETWTDRTGYGTGIVYGFGTWQGYQFLLHSTAIDILDDSSTWSNAWGGLTLTSSIYHPFLASTDGKAYIGCANILSSIAVNAAPFAPGTAGSYTATASALNLPKGTVIRGIQDLGKNLMLMTTTGIYPWDRISSSYNIPLFPNGIAYGGVTVKNLLYFFGKEKEGDIISLFVTDGSNVKFLKDIPIYLYDYIGNNMASITPYQEAIGYQNGKILWNTGIGVLSYSIETGALNCENYSSAGAPSGAYTFFGGLFPIASYSYLAGYKNSSTYILDKTAYGTGSADYTNSFLETPLYEVGSYNESLTCGDIEVVFYKPMTVTSGVKVQYRKNLTDSWTDIKTIDYATYATLPSVKVPSGITSAVNIQFKLIFDNVNTSTPCTVRELRLYP